MTSDSDTTFTPATDQQASEWIAVLSATGVDYSLSYGDGRWTLHVPPAAADTARDEIDAYEEDVRTWPSFTTPSTETEPGTTYTYAPPWITGLVLVAYTWLGPYNGHDPLLRAGAVDAGAVLQGDGWRVVTGLALHADPTHLIGNLVCLLLLEYGLARSFGTGIAWFLLLATGAGGNLAASLLHGAGHISVGASTACFGGLGIVSACQALRNLRHYGLVGGIWSRTWIPLGAGLGLLTLLGTGARSDLVAHALGFVCGLLLAVPFSLFDTERIPAWLQRLLQLACIAVVAAAWTAAWTTARAGN